MGAGVRTPLTGPIALLYHVLRCRDAGVLVDDQQRRGAGWSAVIEGCGPGPSQCWGIQASHSGHAASRLGSAVMSNRNPAKQQGKDAVPVPESRVHRFELRWVPIDDKSDRLELLNWCRIDELAPPLTGPRHPHLQPVRVPFKPPRERAPTSQPQASQPTVSGQAPSSSGAVPTASAGADKAPTSRPAGPSVLSRPPLAQPQQQVAPVTSAPAAEEPQAALGTTTSGMQSSDTQPATTTQQRPAGSRAQDASETAAGPPLSLQAEAQAQPASHVAQHASLEPEPAQPPPEPSGMPESPQGADLMQLD